MKVLVVVAHPRSSSLTNSVAKQFISGLKSAGHDYEFVDLYAENFNPLLMPEDEPDWTNQNKSFSKETIIEMKRIESSDAITFVFPVWWYSVPAILKGYLDRVWNGFVYGPNKLSVQKITWISLIADSQSQFKKWEYDVLLDKYLNLTLASYVGVPDSTVEFIYETNLSNSPEQYKGQHETHYNEILERANKLGKDFVI